MNPNPSIKSKLPIDMPMVTKESSMFGIPLYDLEKDDLLRVIEHLRKDLEDHKQSESQLESFLSTRSKYDR